MPPNVDPSGNDTNPPPRYEDLFPSTTEMDSLQSQKQ